MKKKLTICLTWHIKQKEEKRIFFKYKQQNTQKNNNNTRRNRNRYNKTRRNKQNDHLLIIENCKVEILFCFSVSCVIII